MDENKKPLKNESKVHMIETFGEDMVGVISKDTSGLVQRIIHEQEERETEKKIYSPYSKQNRIFLFVSFLFLFITLGLLGYSYFFNKDDVSSVQNNSVRSPIVVDNTVFVDLTLLSRDEVAYKVNQQKDVTKTKKGQVEALYFTENKKVIGFTRFNTLLKSNFPVSKNPVVNENFMLGIASFEIKEMEISSNLSLEDQEISATESDSVATIGNIYSQYETDPLRYQPEKPTRKDTFILLQVKSFEDIFPVMRSWEEKLLSDLSGLFAIEVKGSKNYLLTKEWEDGIVANKNARILRDSSGNTILFYVFTDDTHIVIATTEDVVEEAIERLFASKIKK